MTEAESRFPAAFDTADAFSLEGQRKTLRGTSARLILTVVATLCLSLGPLWPTEIGEHREIEIVGIIAAALFLVAFLYEVYLLRLKPESGWYDGRAVAESTKTLSWRYAVGGNPYPIGDDADEAFELDIKGLGTDVEALQGAVTAGGRPTAWMRSLRSADLETRRSSYIQGRVRDQEEWYARKARENLRKARMWSLTLLVAEALGVVLALLKALSFITIDLASLAAAVIASGVAWLAVKQHESIGAAYTMASRELASVHVQLLSVDDESRWAEEVASAEEAVSREHTMWRASRTKSDVTHD